MHEFYLSILTCVCVCGDAIKITHVTRDCALNNLGSFVVAVCIYQLICCKNSLSNNYINLYFENIFVIKFRRM
jgi:hypothetical protein